MIKKINMKTTNNPQATLDQMAQTAMDNIKEYQSKTNITDQIPLIKEATSRIIYHINIADQADLDIVLIAVALLLQSGGYMKGVTNRKILVSDYELSKRKVVLAMKSTRCPYSLRTIARANRDLIAQIAKEMEAPGNLYSQYKIYNPEILKQNEETQLSHAIYCTDFQRENSKAPQEVIRFLSEREFNYKNKSNKN